MLKAKNAQLRMVIMSKPLVLPRKPKESREVSEELLIRKEQLKTEMFKLSLFRTKTPSPQIVDFHQRLLSNLFKSL